MTRQTYREPVDVDPSEVEIIDKRRGLGTVVAVVSGFVVGNARPVARKWLVRIDGRLFPPSEDVLRVVRISEVPFRSFKLKRDAVRFLKAEVLAGRFFVPPVRKKERKSCI